MNTVEVVYDGRAFVPTTPVHVSTGTGVVEREQVAALVHREHAVSGDDRGGRTLADESEFLIRCDA